MLRRGRLLIVNGHTSASVSVGGDPRFFFCTGVHKTKLDIMGNENNHYPEFEYAASQLSAFVLSIDTFVISLKNGQMAHFRPKDVKSFRDWLIKHRVRDISVDDGIPKTAHNKPLPKKTKRG